MVATEAAEMVVAAEVVSAKDAVLTVVAVVERVTEKVWRAAAMTVAMVVGSAGGRCGFASASIVVRAWIADV